MWSPVQYGRLDWMVLSALFGLVGGLRKVPVWDGVVTIADGHARGWPHGGNWEGDSSWYVWKVYWGLKGSEGRIGEEQRRADKAGFWTGVRWLFWEPLLVRAVGLVQTLPCHGAVLNPANDSKEAAHIFDTPFAPPHQHSCLWSAGTWHWVCILSNMKRVKS